MYLFFIHGLSTDSASGSDYMVSKDRKIGEQWIRNDREGRNTGLTEGNIPYISWTNRRHLKYLQLFSLNKST